MKFRYSGISTAYQCLKKFEIRYILGIPEEGTSSALSFGTAIHLAIQSMFEGNDYEQTFTMYWNSVKNDISEYPRYSWEQLLEMGKVFLGRFEKSHLKKFKPYKLEAVMEAPLGNNILTGTADFIGLYMDEPAVFDWKTSQSVYNNWKIKSNEQLWIYSYLAEKTFGYKADVVGYKVFCKGEERIQTLTRRLTQDKLDDMLNNVKIMVEDLASRKVFPRNPGCFCTNTDICYPKD